MCDTGPVDASTDWKLQTHLSMCPQGTQQQCESCAQKYERGFRFTDVRRRSL
jgi:hypothetical protein